jgi:hypothetical protein
MIDLSPLKTKFMRNFPSTRLSQTISALPDRVTEPEFMGIARLLLAEADIETNSWTQLNSHVVLNKADRTDMKGTLGEQS